MAWIKKKEEVFTDDQLIEGCNNGKPKYQELLYRRFFSFAMSICLRYASNNDEALEVVNDSYLKLFDNLQNYDRTKPFKTWFAKILVNTAIDSYRRNLKHNSTLSIDTIQEIDEQEPEIDQEISADEILRLFSKLPDSYRVTFNLFEVEGYSHEEIAEMLGVAPSTSRSNLTRAKQMLRKLYSKQITPVKNYHETV